MLSYKALSTIGIGFAICLSNFSCVTADNKQSSKFKSAGSGLCQISSDPENPTLATAMIQLKTRFTDYSWDNTSYLDVGNQFYIVGFPTTSASGALAGFQWYRIKRHAGDSAEWLVADTFEREWISCSRDQNSGGNGNNGGSINPVDPPVDSSFCNTVAEPGHQYSGYPQFSTHKISNGRISLEFTRGYIGSRLYRVHWNGKDILYQNFEGADSSENRLNSKVQQTTWGHDGSKMKLAGGIEAAFPLQEHGLVGNWDWSEGIMGCDPQKGEKYHIATSPQDRYGNIVRIRTFLKPNEDSFYQHVSLLSPQSENPMMYYTNIMLPSNTSGRNNLDRIEIGLNPADYQGIKQDKFIAHSTNGLNFLQNVGAGDINNNKDISQNYINDAARRFPSDQWRKPNESAGLTGSLGYFYIDPVRSFEMKNWTAKYQLTITPLALNGQINYIYPKFFCAHHDTLSAAGTDHAYCEMWFSPNAPTFWHWPKAEKEGVEHLVRIDVRGL